MPADERDAFSEQTASGPLPLSRNASRALVIGSILFVLTVSAGGAWLVLSMARSGPPPSEAVVPADTSDTTAAPMP
jgi:hypothetical protein